MKPCCRCFYDPVFLLLSLIFLSMYKCWQGAHVWCSHTKQNILCANRNRRRHAGLGQGVSGSAKISRSGMTMMISIIHSYSLLSHWWGGQTLMSITTGYVFCMCKPFVWNHTDSREGYGMETLVTHVINLPLTSIQNAACPLNLFMLCITHWKHR